MNKYDFDTVIDRRNSGSMKWDVKEGELPMWVADMDFPTAPEIREALKKRVEHGVFGYSIVPEEWYEAICSFWKRRHHFEMKQEWLLFCTGVIPAISSIVRKLTTPAEQVVVLTPVYNIFFNSIYNNGRNILECPLVYEKGSYHIDFVALEEMLSQNQTTMLLLCNPHNPIGHIWERDILKRIGQLAGKYHVVVVSDEIHCDLTAPGQEYTPYASVSETCRNNSISLIAPTKAFNLAGLQTSAIVVPNPVLRHKVNRGINTDEVAEPNAFAITAAVAAFNEGEAWLDALREYVERNKQAVADFIEDELPMLTLLPSNATYLLWLDCGELTTDSEALAKFIRKETGLFITGGSVYRGNGNQFLRMNVACARSVLEDGLKRLKTGVEAFCNSVCG